MVKHGISWRNGVSVILIMGGFYLLMIDRPVAGFLFIAAGFGFLMWE
ncbi:MAG: hypothetical protein AABX70_07860 [Nanoarchaeota archaeon]